ncbi:hypothetical protein HY991_03235 [Candidatus Micrarchaeota archaeon]|nr:hypothetical protein [Candidatus Micrarchaeota archaeon]
MLFDVEKITKIKEMVFERPRAVNEIAAALDVNWRTADRYLKELEEKTGALSLHTFREGTRGALKVVYWKSQPLPSSSKIQDALKEKILRGVDKADFSTFEIYQHIDPTKRNAFWEEKKKKSKIFFYGTRNLKKSAEEAKNEWLYFCGDMSWIMKESTALSILEKVARKGVSVRILARIDFTNLSFTEKMLKLNKKFGSDAIDLRHIHQPLRGEIVDEQVARFVETSLSTVQERGKEALAFYEIYAEEWIIWLKEIFRELYAQGIPAEKRLEDMKTIRRLPFK